MISSSLKGKMKEKDQEMMNTDKRKVNVLLITYY